MAWQAVSCPECGREVSYLFSVASLPGQRLCSECIRERRHRQDGPPVAPQAHQEKAKKRRRTAQEAA